MLNISDKSFNIYRDILDNLDTVNLKSNYKYLIGKNILNQGFFIVPDGILNTNTYMEILSEAKNEGVDDPFCVFAKYQIYQTKKVRFYQI